MNRHEPDRRNAQWDGAHFASRCNHCDRPIVRIRHGKWVADKRAAVQSDR